MAKTIAGSRRAAMASLLRLGRTPEAEAPLRRAVELREQGDDPDSLWLAEARISLAEWLLAENRAPEARRRLGMRQQT